jgi:hypothetical protein
MPGRRRLLVGTAVAAVILGAIAAILVPGKTGTDVVPSAPSASSRGSSSPASIGSPSASSPESPSPGPATTRVPVRTFRALVAPNDAVIVRVIGNDKRPDAVEVALVALGSGAFDAELQPQVIARLPGSAIPEGLVLNTTGAKYTDAGWIALDVENAATSGRSILIFDIGAPRSAPWVVPGRLSRAAWGPASVLAVPDLAAIRLYDPNGRSVVTVGIPNRVILGGTADERSVPPTWLADGSGFLAWEGEIARQFGRFDLAGFFTLTAAPPAIFQSSGVEREWSPNGSDIGKSCPTAAGCVLSASVDRGPAVVWYSEAEQHAVIQDYAWDAEGDGIWLLSARTTGEGPMAYGLAHADKPNQWVDVGETGLAQPSAGRFEFLGIADAASTAGGRHFLIGPQSSTVEVAVNGRGLIAEFPTDAWFAGWAGVQAPFPAH